MHDYQRDFISFAMDCGVLKFGQFELKSGRISPYFFNTGLFDSGYRLGKLGEFYAQTLVQSGVTPDMLYGPAYKGIPLVSAVAIAYARLTEGDIPFAFNRKEAKDHGEGGIIVGKALTGNVLIVDDVITAGTSVRESVAIIKQAQATPAGVLIALDRQETGSNEVSAVQEVTAEYAMPVLAIISLADIISFLKERGDARLEAIEVYQELYSV